MADHKISERSAEHMEYATKEWAGKVENLMQMYTDPSFSEIYLAALIGYGMAGALGRAEEDGIWSLKKLNDSQKKNVTSSQRIS